MSEDAKLLTLVQWLSPSYPVGSFAWSHGLESAIAEGWVGDGADLHEWLGDLLRHGSLRCDVIFASLAFDATAGKAIIELDEQARAFAASRERVREAERQGAAFSQITREVWGINIPKLLLPLCVGFAAGQMKLDKGSLLLVYSQSLVNNLVLSAQRLMPLGQSDAQRILANLNDSCAVLAQEAQETSFDALFSNCFVSDVAAMRHETLQPKMFQS